MRLVGTLVMSLMLAAAWGRTGSLLQHALTAAVAMNNPLDQDDMARRAGAKLYARECASCHGAKREGYGRAPSLDRPDVHRASPGALFWVLRNGSLHRGMPSFAHLPEPQRWQIITFLRDAREAKVH